jgi:dTDP-4-dehydrorhamnose reductase
MKRVLISGADGQLVTDIINTLSTPENDGFFNVFAFNRKRLDVTDKDALSAVFSKYNPDFFIQGASYHVVEEINKNPKEACDVNLASLHYLTELCNKYDCTLINFSTNYVFSGLKPPLEDFQELDHYNEMDEPSPVNLYGILKYAGEQILSTSCEQYYNIRVSGLFGKTGSRAKNGSNFPYTIKKNLELSDNADNLEPVKVVADQLVNVGYTVDLAEVIVEMMLQEKQNLYGLYHLANKGECTWYEVASKVAEVLGYDEDKVSPISTDEFYTNLKRPKDTSLNMWKVENRFGVKIPRWDDAIERFFKNEVL